MKSNNEPGKKMKSAQRSTKAADTSSHRELLATLRVRFEDHESRHRGVDWSKVQSRLEAHPEKLGVLSEMERTGGEPDVVGFDAKTGSVRFVDCSAESPSGRRSLCYDGAALEARKEHKPAGSALDRAEAMGIVLLSEAEYRELQTLGEFDRKTSSWIRTPGEIRIPGGALYAERRYGRIFVGHNGAQSYYAVRGFRGSLDV